MRTLHDSNIAPRSRTAGLVAAVAAAVLIAACGQDADPPKADSGRSTTTSGRSTTTEATLVTAPAADRIDRDKPTFSDPTAITNPLFPISDLTQVVQLGIDEGEPLRVEATLLPQTKSITWEGTEIETVVSQFIAYLDGRVAETTLDYFAQADDGSVWYFGEDVTNYEDGAVKDNEGTWLAGVDGPPGMIMPADPQVGDVYRPENIPDLVFEEVTVKAVDTTVEGPQGSLTGAITIQELLMDGTTEDKSFAPGYGEFSAHTDTEDIVVALGVPLDAVEEPTPAELTTISAGATEVLADPDGAAAALETIRTAAEAYQGPEVLTMALTDAVDALGSAVDAGEGVEAAAIVVEQAALDLRARHEPVADIDAGRMAAWAAQAKIDAEADEAGGVASDLVALDTIAERIEDLPAEVTGLLDDLHTAVDADELATASSAAEALRAALV